MLTLMYRGPLASCNYACEYCPFAKKVDSRADLERDASALARFVAWVGARQDDTAVFFTPWGEALIRRAYREAIAELSRMPHVRKVAIQTNLSAPLDFLSRCDVARVGLWCTFHPGEVALERFLAACGEVRERGASFSVGIVGRPQHIAIAAELRSALPSDVYVWVNAEEGATYDAEHLAALAAIDPLFGHNVAPPPSLGAPCAAGHEVVSVNGDGDVRRCHFVQEVIGNLYQPGFERALFARPCPNDSCTCHIGYVHRRDLPLAGVFGDGILERRLPVVSSAQVSSSGAYSEGSSKPAIHAAASWQRLVVGGTRST